MTRNKTTQILLKTLQVQMIHYNEILRLEVQQKPHQVHIPSL